MPSRRQCLIGAGTAAAGMVFGSAMKQAMAEAASAGLKVGMCDWSLKGGKPSDFDLAKRIGLNGVEVSIGYPKDNLWLRRPEVQKQYLEAAGKTGLSIPSVAMGVLNDVPLMSEPRAALWVADTIEAARSLGARCILLAFFGKGELKAENSDDMRRVTEVLAELAPRAEKAGVILGIESYLSAEVNLKILDEVNSKAVQVYYDFFNSGVTKNHDVLKEIRLLGRDRICQVHFKEGSHLLGQSKKIDWPAVVATLKEIAYAGWVVLETSSPSKDVGTDTRANLQYVRKLFAA
ncbi:MAG TPA: sugar phosphate isomerase/epimerase family protein [Phycisphaerae bacterium]|nr:sugar phosphate isomerase/epimerase family protein [Phycisphaerae bacterium]